MLRAAFYGDTTDAYDLGCAGALSIFKDNSLMDFCNFLHVEPNCAEIWLPISWDNLFSTD